MAAHEVKDWNEIHQKLQEMAYDDARSYKERFVFWSDVR